MVRKKNQKKKKNGGGGGKKNTQHHQQQNGTRQQLFQPSLSDPVFPLDKENNPPTNGSRSKVVWNRPVFPEPESDSSSDDGRYGFYRPRRFFGNEYDSDSSSDYDYYDESDSDSEYGDPMGGLLELMYLANIFNSMKPRNEQVVKECVNDVVLEKDKCDCCDHPSLVSGYQCKKRANHFQCSECYRSFPKEEPLPLGVRCFFCHSLFCNRYLDKPHQIAFDKLKRMVPKQFPSIFEKKVKQQSPDEDGIKEEQRKTLSIYQAILKLLDKGTIELDEDLFSKHGVDTDGLMFSDTFSCGICMMKIFEKGLLEYFSRN